LIGAAPSPAPRETPTSQTNSRTPVSRAYTRLICAAILRIQPLLLFTSSMHTCPHHILAFFQISKGEQKNLLKQLHVSYTGMGNVGKYCESDKFQITPPFVIQDHHCIALLNSITQHQKS
jgi:hypothetical protein